jgi:hypothetical protein
MGFGESTDQDEVARSGEEADSFEQFADRFWIGAAQNRDFRRE